jgi:hypothetical protein
MHQIRDSSAKSNGYIIYCTLISENNAINLHKTLRTQHQSKSVTVVRWQAYVWLYILYVTHQVILIKILSEYRVKFLWTAIFIPKRRYQLSVMFPIHIWESLCKSFHDTKTYMSNIYGCASKSWLYWKLNRSSTKVPLHTMCCVPCSHMRTAP